MLLALLVTFHLGPQRRVRKNNTARDENPYSEINTLQNIYIQLNVTRLLSLRLTTFFLSVLLLRLIFHF
jgi:hypothetical protein